jgi:membrane complex biogenesis BtpA family protein
MRQLLSTLFKHTRPLIGVVHLKPLPGSPRWRGSMQEVIDLALRDAQALTAGGMDAIIVENFGDIPFYPQRVPAETVAAIAVAVSEVKHATTLPVGVNVLRNDAASGLGICAATGASFIRVNVHSGAMLTDQGWIQSSAYETLRLRKQLGLGIAILADILVKHAVAPAGLTIEDAARDTWERGLADALIVSGAGTGIATEAADVARAKRAVPESTVLVGSGLTAQNAPELLRLADGAIVGSWIKCDGHADSPVSVERVQQIVEIRNGTAIAS